MNVKDKIIMVIGDNKVENLYELGEGFFKQYTKSIDYKRKD